MIIVMPSLSKSSVFKMFTVHTETKSRRFQIPAVWRAIIHCSWLVLRSSFRPGQGTHQRPFCLANSLGIAPKVPFANKMITERFEERFRKAPFSWRINVDGRTNRRKKSCVFKFFQFEERFRKAQFSRRISVDGRPKRWNKAPFSNSCGVVWTGYYRGW